MGSLSERLEKARTTRNIKGQARGQDTVEYYDEFGEFKDKAQDEVVKRMSHEENGGEEELLPVIKEVVEVIGDTLPNNVQKRLIDEIYNDMSGFGPIESLLRNEKVSEIMVNGPYSVYVEESGRLRLSDVKFRDDNHVREIIDRIVTPLGRRCDEARPMVDARLPDGSRVNAIIPPLALNGPSITIRKFSKDPITADNLIDFQSASFPMLSFLEACVEARANIIVSGGTGSGKTTLLNVLSGYISDRERIVTIEDAAELQLQQRHVITLESRPANIEGSGEVSIRDLVRNALRMRPDRIIVGECRAGETLDMLQAMNTGHDGSITTAHANSPRDLMARLETMVLMGGMDLPIRAIREQIASAFDIIVQQSRLRDGSRKITEISEVVGIESDVITMQSIFRYQVEGYDGAGKAIGRFAASGIRPRIIEQFKEMGIRYRDSWFEGRE